MVRLQRFGSYCQPSASGSSRTSSASIGGNGIRPWRRDGSSATRLILAGPNTPSGAQAVTRAADNQRTMQDNVDYRLVERFNAKRHVNRPRPVSQSDERRVAGAGAPRPMPTIGLRD